jgi:hypothetical protein
LLLSDSSLLSLELLLLELSLLSLLSLLTDSVLPELLLLLTLRFLLFFTFSPFLCSSILFFLLTELLPPPLPLLLSVADAAFFLRFGPVPECTGSLFI